MAAKEKQKNFLDPKTVSLISNYQLLAQLILDSFFVGQHMSRKHAFSLEYSGHRPYFPGDPLKQVDWKYYSRTDKLFVKQSYEETNLTAWIVMDISKSMSYAGSEKGISKLKYASYLASAITFLLVSQQDLVGLLLFDDRIQKAIPPRSSTFQMRHLLKEFQNLKEGGVSQFEHSAKLVANYIKKRSLIILFSDFLGEPKEIEKTLKQFIHKGSELIVFHVLTEEELKFPFEKFSFFEDLETHEKILLQPSSLHDEYQVKMTSFLEQIKKSCANLAITYQLLHTSTPFDESIRQFLKAREVML